MRKFLSDINTNNALQALLTLLVWGSICYLYIKGQAVPDSLLTAGSVVLGYYFHTAATSALTFKAQAKV